MAENYEALIRAKATELGVDPDFASYIGFQENQRHDPNAVSPKGAFGIMQVMSGTAKDLAPRYGNDNISQGVGYLKDLSDTFQDIPADQRSHFIAAAYNGGPERVMKLMEAAAAKGMDPYNIASLADDLPDETVNYVANIGERMAALRQPKEGEARQLQPPQDKSVMDILEQPETAPAPSQTAARSLYNTVADVGSRALDYLTPPPGADVSPGGTFVRSMRAQGEAAKGVGRRTLASVKGLGDYASELMSQGILDTPVARHLQAGGDVARVLGTPAAILGGVPTEALYRQTANQPTERNAELANMGGQGLLNLGLAAASRIAPRMLGSVGARTAPPPAPMAAEATESSPLYHVYPPTTQTPPPSPFTPEFAKDIMQAEAPIPSLVEGAAPVAAPITTAAVAATPKNLSRFSVAIAPALGAYIGYKATGEGEGTAVGAILGHPIRAAVGGGVKLTGRGALGLFNFFKNNPATLPILAQLMATPVDDPQHQELANELAAQAPVEGPRTLKSTR